MYALKTVVMHVVIVDLCLVSVTTTAAELARYSTFRELYIAIAQDVLPKPSDEQMFQLAVQTIGNFRRLPDGRILLQSDLRLFDFDFSNDKKVHFRNARFCAASDLDCVMYFSVADGDGWVPVQRLNGSVVKSSSPESNSLRLLVYQRVEGGAPRDMCYLWNGRRFVVVDDGQYPCSNAGR